ncbi:MAG: sulfotransferase [Planctomycetota bacterium]|nr:sulfotransferase [Planctomycetota bacterium]
MTEQDAKVLRKTYLDGAAFLRRASAKWTLDKSLHSWRWLPLIAAVIPSTVVIAITRNQRDSAISTFLGNFHPKSFGWTGSMESIRRVGSAHRSIVPMALDRLGLAHESIEYEGLVGDPAGFASRCLAKMGLVMNDATVAPEGNQRTVLTLSHEQVRRPINRASIDRWRNYEWAFDTRWDGF